MILTIHTDRMFRYIQTFVKTFGIDAEIYYQKKWMMSKRLVKSEVFFADNSDTFSTDCKDKSATCGIITHNIV